MGLEERNSSESEYYSDSIECSEEMDDVCDNNSEYMNLGDCSKSNINISGKLSDDDDDIIISNKRINNADSFQEDCSQNSNFINLNNEIESISIRIESINKSIRSMISNISPYACILEELIPEPFRSDGRCIVNIGTEGIKIGRSLDSELPKNRNRNGLMMLSREHAYIYIKQNNGKSEPYIVDCNSKNGTFVNNIKIKTRKLKLNDIISLGCKNNSNNIYKYKVIKT